MHDSSTLVRPNEKTKQRSSFIANKKWALNCCHRIICTECLRQFGKRLSARKESDSGGIHRAKRSQINDNYNSGVQLWIQFCRSGCYTYERRLARAREVASDNTLRQPPKQTCCQSLMASVPQVYPLTNKGTVVSVFCFFMLCCDDVG